MDHNKTEVAIIQESVSEATDGQVRELTDFQLAVVGGGIADTIPH